ncbi:hypothetical protein, partial [Streptomyces radiopugnans]|uniref:hypothetical protein n=1 Tax=Streptomyces radiopugnans TaxID=403935 RepID=UPI001C42ECDB
RGAGTSALARGAANRGALRSPCPCCARVAPSASLREPKAGAARRGPSLRSLPAAAAALPGGRERIAVRAEGVPLRSTPGNHPRG